MKPVTFQAGQSMTSNHSPDQSAYLLRSGTVVCSRGETFEVAGSFLADLGSMALNVPPEWTYSAQTTVEAFELPHAEIYEFLRSYPGLYLRLFYED